MSRSTTGLQRFTGPIGHHRGRHLRKAQRPAAAHVIGVRSVEGDELFLAVAFLAKALHLPDLDPKASQTRSLCERPEVLRAA
jgi:hypothetical protein